MKREDIIRMAREAGIEFTEHLGIGGRNNIISNGSKRIEVFERFFQAAYAAGEKAERNRIESESKHIIKRAEARGAAAEREAVLDLVDDYAKDNTDLRDAIRARSQQ